MSAKTVAVARSMVDALNAGDQEAFMALVARDFEYDLTRTESPMRGVYPRRKLVQAWNDFLGDWEHYYYEVHRMIDAGDNVVIVYTTHFTGRGGIEVKGDATWVCTFRGERIVRVCLYQDEAEACAAAGVPAVGG
jgi:ketosteroid isomerase-like protein